MENFDQFTQNAGQYTALELDEETIRSLSMDEVFVIDIRHLNSTHPYKYYKNTLPEMDINLCKYCNHFFLQDEYEFAYLERKACPFCRVAEDKEIET